jgi:hypothetical protein
MEYIRGRMANSGSVWKKRFPAKAQRRKARRQENHSSQVVVQAFAPSALCVFAPLREILSD